MDGQVYLVKLRKAFAQMVESAQPMSDSEIRVAFHWFTSGADWRGTQQIYTDERVVALLDARDAEIERLSGELSGLVDVDLLMAVKARRP